MYRVRKAAKYILTSFLITLTQQGNTHEDVGYVPKEIWNQVKPYLLPIEHPARPTLDSLFTYSRVTANKESIRKAGFKNVAKQEEHIHTVKHPSIKGYVISIITDEDAQYSPAWQHWVKHVEGANLIRDGIKKHFHSHIFKVPKKWIYLLPKFPLPREEVSSIAKHFILVSEDMNQLTNRDNHTAHKNKTKKRHLKALFNFVQEYGLSRSCNADNIPWCRDKKIAFIDTEYFKCWPVDFTPILQYLSSSERVYWRQLIKSVSQ